MDITNKKKISLANKEVLVKKIKITFGVMLQNHKHKSIKTMPIDELLLAASKFSFPSYRINKDSCETRTV